MALADILSGLGGLGEGYLKGTNQLQQIQSQQYLNALRMLAMQQQVQGGGAAWQALAQNPNLMGQPGGQLPTMAPGQIQAEPLPPPSPNMADLPQVPAAASQMADSGDELLRPNLANRNVRWDQESPRFQKDVSDMLKAMPADLRSQAIVDSAGRTPGEQQNLFDRYKSGLGGMAGSPTTSRHVPGNTGIPGFAEAADWNRSSPQALDWMRKYGPQFGVGFPLESKGDPDHMQLLDANKTVQQLQQATPPTVKAAAQPAAVGALRSFGGSPLDQVGRHDPSAIIKAIDKANPDAPDFIKFSAFHQLYPLLTNAGKLDFAEAVKLMQVGQAETRLDLTKQRLEDQERTSEQSLGLRREMLDLREQLAAQGGGGRAPRFGTVDDLMSRWRDDFVRENGREPTTQEIADQKRDFAQEVKPPTMTNEQINTRLGIAANDVNKTVTAMTKLGPGATLGIFGGAQSKLSSDPIGNIKRSLLNEVTPQATQMMATLGNGLGRSLASLAAGGSAQGLVGLSEQLSKDIPAAGDKGMNVLLKYADMRQIADAALEVLDVSPRITKEQKEKMRSIAEQIHQAVPFTTADVAGLVAGDDQSIADFAKTLGLGGGSKVTAPTGMSDDAVKSGIEALRKEFGLQ